MAKRYSIKKQLTREEWITLYDEKDFNDHIKLTIESIDKTIAYLQDAKEQLVGFKPSDLDGKRDRYDPSNVPIKLKENFYRVMVDERSCWGCGCGADVSTNLENLNIVAWNIYNQGRYADRIEEYDYLFHG